MMRLPESSNEEQTLFLVRWVNDHIQDAQIIIEKPVLFAEFGVSVRNMSTSDGGAATGGLFWHLLAEGMDSFKDGYEVLLDENSSTATLIAQESQKLNRIRMKKFSIDNTKVKQVRN
ncbi:Mannan endo-1,4-beta-mannosidase [Vigna angularis]|uniref:Mannan endo-1,4-beta-mannosidase n=1 Tax=Phaseolus angularis TaxID=3914 RepID=A0A8T0K0C5_PHAAN|nr:Mannan endo-1,4-beta-mannosidase [Vigna angularis]